MTTYYAQQSSVNIDSANLWNTAQDGSGSYLTWANLTADDVLNANGKTGIAINVDFTCQRIETDVSLGGQFTIAADRTITCNVQAGSSTCIYCYSGSGTSNIIGNVIGGLAASARGIHLNTGAVTFKITGTVAGGSASSAFGFWSGSSGSLYITGDIVGGTHYTAYGVSTALSMSLYLTGNIVNTVAVAISGLSVVYNPDSTNYIEFPGPNSTTKRFYYDIPDVANVRDIDTVAGIQGTYTGGSGGGGQVNNPFTSIFFK
jgi:ethanolamine utilization microcompartment shell protein EutS